jgi:hypothetical protein
MSEQIIRVHTAEGVVYARRMERFPFLLGSWVFIEMVDVPAGLTQQGVVNHFRAQGWTVEQDHGIDSFNPEWGE